MTFINDLPLAYIKHQLAGRVRLKIPTRRGNEEYFEFLAETLVECEAIDQLQTNSVAGSLLIESSEQTLIDIMAFAEARGLFIIVDGDEIDGFIPAHRSIADWSSRGVSLFDSQLNLLSDGRVDLRSVFFLGFMGLAVHQAVRGNFMSPATTFFWRALELLNKNDSMFESFKK